jgi:hypothetical protein
MINLECFGERWCGIWTWQLATPNACSATGYGKGSQLWSILLKQVSHLSIMLVVFNLIVPFHPDWTFEKKFGWLFWLQGWWLRTSEKSLRGCRQHLDKSCTICLWFGLGWSWPGLWTTSAWITTNGKFAWMRWTRFVPSAAGVFSSRFKTFRSFTLRWLASTHGYIFFNTWSANSCLRNGQFFVSSIL